MVPAPITPPDGSPDVILIVLDEVGFGSVGCYGSVVAHEVVD